MAMSAQSTPPPSGDTITLQFSNSVFLVHKPLAVLCSKHDESKDLQRGPVRETVYELAEANGFPGSSFNLVGRLDADTSGLILFTNNLRLLNAINHPLRPDLTTVERELMRPFKEKEYVAIVRPDKSILKQWRENGADSFSSTELETLMSRPFSFDYKGEHFEVSQSRVEFIRRYSDIKYTYGRPDLMGWCIEIRIHIAEGKHHQIRRMATRCGYKVIALARVRIAGTLTIDSLPNPGSCRWLTSAEERQLKDGLKCEAVCDSTRAINPSLTCANDDALKAGGGSP